jgi:hypothetical protein
LFALNDCKLTKSQTNILRCAGRHIGIAASFEIRIFVTTNTITRRVVAMSAFDPKRTLVAKHQTHSLARPIRVPRWNYSEGSLLLLSGGAGSNGGFSGPTGLLFGLGS